MRRVSVSELHQRASEIVRLVREEKQEVEITYRGKVVARIVPVTEREARERDHEIWAEWRRLAKEVSAAWPKGVSAVEAVREQRGEL